MWGFPGGASGKEPACQWRKHNETQVQSLGREDPLEKSMATLSSFLGFLENPLERGAWWATVHSIAESDLTEAT